MDNRRNENSVSEVENIDEEKLRTLWCGSINERVNENILFELFLNAGPLERVSIPKDRDSGRQKGYAFIVFQHVESIKYAFELLNGTELFRQPIRLQQKETGLGLGQQSGRSQPQGISVRTGGGSHSRSLSNPVYAQRQPQQMFSQPPPMSPPVWNGYPPYQHQQAYPQYGYGGQGNGQYQYSQYQAQNGSANTNTGYNEGYDRREEERRDRDRRGDRYRDNGRDRSYGRDRDRDRDRSYDRNYDYDRSRSRR